MAIPPHIHSKSALRQFMRQHPAGLPHSSTSTCDALRNWLDAGAGLRNIAVFSALPGELDLSGLIAGDANRRWLFPKVNGDELTFHQVENPDIELVSGAFGIREPSAGLPAFPLDQIDAFLCPGLAFDTAGGRLGRGRGFYDRVLALAQPDAQKIGVCFPHQIVDDTFMEPHDIRMHGVIF